MVAMAGDNVAIDCLNFTTFSGPVSSTIGCTEVPKDALFGTIHLMDKHGHEQISGGRCQHITLVAEIAHC